MSLALAIIGLATEVAKLVNTEESLKYVDKLYNLKIDILKEENRGYDADDARLETLYQELKITIEALSNAVSAHTQSAPQAQAGPVT